MNARKIILWLVILVVAANLALVVVVALGMRQPDVLAPALPKPNGHDDFVKAEKMLTTKADDYTNLNVGQLRAIVATNAPAMRLARAGLDKECVMPIEDLKWDREAHLAELNSFKRLALAFSGEATLAELEHRFNDAASIWLELVRFSHASCRGGAYVDATLGGQGENFSLFHLDKLLKILDAGGCMRVAKALEAVDSQTDTLAQIVSQNIAYTGKLTFSQSFTHLLHFRRFRRADAMFAAKYNEQARQRRTAMVNFAARAYELSKGKRPPTLNDLVPAYLKTVPLDPATGLALEYKP